jgi:hypothetical protein
MTDLDQDVVSVLERLQRELDSIHRLQRAVNEYALLLEKGADLKLVAGTIAEAVTKAGRTVYSLSGGRGTDGKIMIIVKC